jgi:hypothetical protein
MYSPKIRETLIPRIYRAARDARLPMTAWVSQAIEQALPDAAPTEQTPNHRKETSDGTHHSLFINDSGR